MKKTLSTLIITCLLLSACGTKSSPKIPTQTLATLEAYEINVKNNDTFTAQIQEYDLGSKQYTSQAGKVMPYNVRGVIGVPEGNGPFPIVFITHGSHSNEDETLRFDTGFTYLVESLAKNGYIAVSMDMSSAYIWKYGDNDDKEKSIPIARDHIEALKAANEGTSEFSVNLKDKIDFKNTAYIGHSRGGDTIFDIALDQQSDWLNVKSLISIAPTAPNNLETKNWPDAEVAIIVPEYDGDVVSLDGLNIYSVLDQKSDNLNSVTLLRRANHNYFNTNLIKNDAELSRNTDELTDQLTADEQQNFLTNFCIDFLSASIHGQTTDTMYDITTQSPNKMYGYDVMNRISTPNDFSIIDINDTTSMSSNNCTIKPTTDAWFYQNDEVLIDTVTFGQDTYGSRRLLNIRWEQPSATLTFTPQESDFSNHRSLTLNVVTDSADTLNNSFNAQSFDIILEDKNGSTASVTLPQSMNTLQKISGKIDITPLDKDVEIKYWSNPTPISNIRIPLRIFEGIDLTSIESVTLNFDQNNTGAIYLESVLLQD